MASASRKSQDDGEVEGKYSDIDEYGFIRRKDFDFKSYENFISEYTSVLVRRKGRWNQLLDNGKKTKLKLDTKVRRFCRKGVPMEYRKMVWMSVSGAQKQLANNRGLYQVLITAEDDSEKDRELRSAIKTDIERTFPDNIYFRGGEKKEDGKLPALERVLLAIGRHKTEIGYCQGMNYIAGLLLLVLEDEESVFWLFVTVLEKFISDYYCLDMIGVRRDMDVLSELVQERFPDVASCLDRESVNWLLLSSKWFICLYADVLPTETVFRIWDCFFTEGPKILFRVALQLVKIRANEVRKAEDMPGIVAAFKNIDKEHLVIECHTFMQECFVEEKPLRMGQVTSLRGISQVKIEQEDQEVKERKKKRQET